MKPGHTLPTRVSLVLTKPTPDTSPLTKARRFERRNWTERTCVVKRGCVFSIIVWILIIVIVLALLGFFARGRR
jgi:hypothetical protein